MHQIAEDQGKVKKDENKFDFSDEKEYNVFMKSRQARLQESQKKSSFGSSIYHTHILCTLILFFALLK